MVFILNHAKLKYLCQMKHYLSPFNINNFGHAAGIRSKQSHFWLGLVDHLVTRYLHKPRWKGSILDIRWRPWWKAVFSPFLCFGVLYTQYYDQGRKFMRCWRYIAKRNIPAKVYSFKEYLTIDWKSSFYVKQTVDQIHNFTLSSFQATVCKCEW